MNKKDFLKMLQQTPTYLKPIFLYSELNSSSTAIQRFLHLISTSIFSFITIAFFLLVASKCCPQLYKGLTKWANQPPMPIVRTCELRLVSRKDWDFGEMYPNLRKYILEFDINSSIGEVAYGISYIEDNKFSILPESTSSLPSLNNLPYVVFDKRNFKKKPPRVVAFYNAERGELDELKFEAEECPVRFEFFGDKK